MKYFLLFLLLFNVTGCSYLQYLPTNDCDKVEYLREGNDITINAKCRK